MTAEADENQKPNEAGEQKPSTLWTSEQGEAINELAKDKERFRKAITALEWYLQVCKEFDAIFSETEGPIMPPSLLKRWEERLAIAKRRLAEVDAAGEAITEEV